MGIMNHGIFLNRGNVNHEPYFPLWARLILGWG